MLTGDRKPVTGAMGYHSAIIGTIAGHTRIGRRKTVVAATVRVRVGPVCVVVITHTASAGLTRTRMGRRGERIIESRLSKSDLIGSALRGCLRARFS